MTAASPSPNLLEMTPSRAREWSAEEDGVVRVMVPRYGDSSVGRWITRRLGMLPICVRLDGLGSSVWRACDGRQTVAEIAARLQREAGIGPDEAHERLSRFFLEMERSRFIRWQPRV